MSALRPHIRAARALAEAFAFEGNESGDERNALLLCRISAAYSRAARSMEAEEAANEAEPVVIHRQSAGQVAEALAEPAPKEWHHPACAVQVGLPCNNDCPRDYEGWGKGCPVQREGA